MAELYDASDEVLAFRYPELPGGLVIEDTETHDAVIEVARNYSGDDYANHPDPVFLRAADDNGNYVVVGLNVEAATKLRDALNGIVTLYS